MQAFRANPDESLYNLCIGLTFIHMASQKYVLKRHALLVQVSECNLFLPFMVFFTILLCFLASYLADSCGYNMLSISNFS